jgi:hypothetical protein
MVSLGVGRGGVERLVGFVVGVVGIVGVMGFGFRGMAVACYCPICKFLGGKVYCSWVVSGLDIAVLCRGFFE